MTDSRRDTDEIEVRVARQDDVRFAAAASALIKDYSDAHDIVDRAVDYLEQKIETGRAAVALHDDELVGFGFWSDWENGKFISHSGLVVRRDHWNRGLGRRIKEALFDSSRARFPQATLMSLTNSAQVKALNLSLGFVSVPLDRLTSDPKFWAGCVDCRNYQEVQARGDKCCCEGMIREPDVHPGTA